MTAIWALWKRELVRFYRDRSRIVGALTPPILFWFLIGAGLGTSFHLPGASGGLNFLQYFFGGTLVLIVLFTSIFATISIIEDRREGFLQSVLIAPIPRASIVLGKVLGASTVGWLQGLTFLVFAAACGIRVPLSSYAVAAAALLLCSVGLTCVGFCIAWALDSTQGFHAVMNLFLIPMWMLSGALFPISTAPVWLQWVIRANPTTYAVSALQDALLPEHAAAAGLAGLPLCFAVMSGFAVLMILASAWLARQRSER